MTRVLIVRLGSLGDLVHTVPAIAATRRGDPSLEIDWLVDAPHREFVELVPLITSAIVLKDRTVAAWLDARQTLHTRRYAAAVDFQGLFKSAALARLSGAPRIVGFDAGSLRERSAALLYTERVHVGDAEDGAQHVIQKNLRLAAHLGAPIDRVEFPLADVDSRVAADMRARLSDPYAILNPGAAWPNKRWPPAAFGDIAKRILAQYGWRSLVLWGPGELELARAVAAAAGESAIAAPETTVGDLVALARHARLFVSGDTGPLHLAAAVNTPVVALFGPTNHRRNGPWNATDVTITRYAACDCHYERQCRRSDGWCLGTIAADEVMQAIEAVTAIKAIDRRVNR